MDIKVKQIDELNLVLTLTIAHDDYAEPKRKKLADYRRKVEIRGFRKGMVPASLIEKMYGKQVLVEAVDDLIAEGLNNYINENKLRVVGEPLPCEDQPQTDWTDGNDFEFSFDLAQNPELKLDLSTADEVVYYNITVTAEAKKDLREQLLRQCGELQDSDESKADDFLIVDFKQGETSVEGAYVALRSVAEAVRPSFIGLKPGDEIEVNVNEAFENESDRATMLNVKKEELADLDPQWKMAVVNVRTFVPAEPTQEIFDKIYGAGKVSDEAGFEAKVEEQLRYEYVQEADMRLKKDIKDYLLAKTSVELPEKFLKRWIKATNEGKLSDEEIEKEWPAFIEDYKWELVRDAAAKELDVKITEDDLKSFAKSFAAYQYSMYGLNNVPDEQLEGFAESLLADERQRRRIVEQVEDNNTLNAVRNVITLKKKKISLKNFREL